MSLHLKFNLCLLSGTTCSLELRGHVNPGNSFGEVFRIHKIVRVGTRSRSYHSPQVQVGTSDVGIRQVFLIVDRHMENIIRSMQVKGKLLIENRIRSTVLANSSREMFRRCVKTDVGIILTNQNNRRQAVATVNSKEENSTKITSRHVFLGTINKNKSATKETLTK